MMRRDMREIEVITSFMLGEKKLRKRTIFRNYS